MRLLHVLGGRLYGGVEVALESIHRERPRSPGLEMDFAVCYEGRPAERFEAAGATVHRLGPLRASRPLSIRRSRAALRGVLRRGGYDAMVSHLAWAQALLGPAARSAGVPLISWYHDPTVHRWHPLDAWARRTPPDLMICNSRYSAGRMARYYPGTPIEVMSYPVSPPRRRRLEYGKPLGTSRAPPPERSSSSRSADGSRTRGNSSTSRRWAAWPAAATGPAGWSANRSVPRRSPTAIGPRGPRRSGSPTGYGSWAGSRTRTASARRRTSTASRTRRPSRSA